MSWIFPVMHANHGFRRQARELTKWSEYHFVTLKTYALWSARKPPTLSKLHACYCAHQPIFGIVIRTGSDKHAPLHIRSWETKEWTISKLLEHSHDLLLQIKSLVISQLMTGIASRDYCYLCWRIDSGISLLTRGISTVSSHISISHSCVFNSRFTLLGPPLPLNLHHI